MTMLDRRTLLTVATAAAAGAAALTPEMAAAQTGIADEVIDLWPGDPPGRAPVRITRKVDEKSSDPAKPDRWVTGIARPVLVVRRPARPNGSAVLLMPGGGYGFVSYDNEGTSQAAWLNARGITAFILLYRLPGEGWQRRQDVPLQDAQRAMRLIRERATTFAIRPNAISVIGFSAGGHLAGSLATRHAEKVYEPRDAADRLSARPDLVGLIYPVITLEAYFTHGGSRDNLIGPGASAMGAELRARSVDQRVDAQTPPVFLVHAVDDGLVPPAHSILMFQAMQAARRPVALHIFEDGGHGFGVRLPRAMSASAWPSLFVTFAARHGVLPA